MPWRKASRRRPRRPLSTSCRWPMAAKGRSRPSWKPPTATYREVVVSGPLGEPVTARYGLLGDGRTAVLEMASASGLVLVTTDRRDVMRASTFGTGELIRDGGRGPGDSTDRRRSAAAPPTTGAPGWPRRWAIGCSTPTGSTSRPEAARWIGSTGSFVPRLIRFSASKSWSRATSRTRSAARRAPRGSMAPRRGRPRSRSRFSTATWPTSRRSSAATWGSMCSIGRARARPGAWGRA